MDKTIYDISQYNDQELYRMLDLDHPTDRELEMKIIVLIQKYQDMDNPMGKQMYQFFNDIYHHFFEDDLEEETEVEEEVVGIEGFENPSTTPPVIQTSGNWTGAELDILPSGEVSRGTAITASPSQKAGVASENTVKVGINTDFGSSKQNKQIGYQKSLDYTKGSLNPIIKETIQRIISIDSQFRDVNVYPYSTDFTFNLSDTLTNVVSLKLYSVQIPFTWYTVSNAYGSNFFYLTGNSPGIKGTGYYDISINIPSGNYQALELVNRLSNSLKNSISVFPDINFGPTTDITYNSANSRATITLDIQQIYNESYYRLEFPTYYPVQITQFFMNFTSTPYMIFQCKHPYYTNTINDVSLIVPPPIQDSSNNLNTNVVTYGYNISSFFSTMNTVFQGNYQNRIHGIHNFSSTTIYNMDITQNSDNSHNLVLNYNFNYRIPAYYDNTNSSNFSYSFISYDENSEKLPWGESPWNNIYEFTPNPLDIYGVLTVESKNTDIPSKRLDQNINISSINKYNKTLIRNDGSTVDLYTRINQSWYDSSNHWFVDQSFNTYIVPNDTYFYDISSLVIQIKPDYTTYGNVNNLLINIPIIIIGEELTVGDTTSGIAMDPAKFKDLLNKTLTNNAKLLAQNYRIYLNPTPFTFSSSIIHFDTSISVVLTEKDYTVSFYDTNGYPDNSSYAWNNTQNFWSKYLSLPDPSYNLSNINPIRGDKPFIELDSSFSDKIYPTLDQYSLQKFLGFDRFPTEKVSPISTHYNMSTMSTNLFLGSVYKSNLIYPTVKVPSIYLDDGFSVFDIYLYQSTVINLGDPSLNTTTNYSNPSSVFDSSYSITYSGLSSIRSLFTFKQITDSINTSLQSVGIFTKDSGISIIDYTSGDTITGDLTDLNKYFFQLKILFDRNKIKPNTNMKIYIKINDTETLLDNLKFIIPITDTGNDIELSEIVSESNVLSNTSTFTSNPYVYLRCITPGYSGYPDNDISFTLQNPKEEIGYTMSQYMAEIQRQISNPAWGLSGVADLNGEKNSFRMGVNIKHIIPGVTNGQSNFTIDFSKTVLKQMNKNHTWIVDSSYLIHTFDNLVFSGSYNVGTDNNKIKVTLQGPSQGSDDVGSYPFDTSFVTYFYIKQGTYTVENLMNEINTSVFGYNIESDSSYPLYEFDTDNLKKYTRDIPNGRVNMYGSFIKQFTNQTDITQNKIEFNFSIRSILTYKDYHMEFYDPGKYTQNPSFGPGLTNQAQSPLPQYRQFYYDVANTSMDYVNSYTYIEVGPNTRKLNTNFAGTWNSTENSWYNYLYVPDPSYLLIKQPLFVLNDISYALISGTKTITDQRLWLDANNNYFTIKPNFHESGGVFVKNPSVYTGINSDANDIVIKLDLDLNRSYNSEEIINGFNDQLSSNPITFGSYISIDKLTHHTIIRLNVNKIFTAQDYSITFYEPNLFTHCSYGSNPSILTTTQDTTLGWLLGFRNLSIYDLNKERVIEYNGTGISRYSINYTCDSNNIVSITGDASVSITLYNYFLIILDDYTQNHLNDGLVTVNSPFADISLPSYANRNTHRCNTDFSQNNNPKETIYIGNSRDPTNNNNLTLKQLYSANQILNNQQNNNKSYQSNMGIYVQDIFGIIPVKTSGLINGQTYVEFGGTLQNQDRTYFGPVNIKRMAVRILTDKGNILDLNNANISFSLIAQQLYNPYARG
jgi:hypothetical protein